MCIRFLIHAYMPVKQEDVYHPYPRGASALRPDSGQTDVPLQLGY